SPAKRGGDRSLRDRRARPRAVHAGLLADAGGGFHPGPSREAPRRARGPRRGALHVRAGARRKHGGPPAHRRRGRLHGDGHRRRHGRGGSYLVQPHSERAPRRRRHLRERAPRARVRNGRTNRQGRPHGAEDRVSDDEPEARQRALSEGRGLFHVREDRVVPALLPVRDEHRAPAHRVRGFRDDDRVVHPRLLIGRLRRARAPVVLRPRARRADVSVPAGSHGADKTGRGGDAPLLPKTPPAMSAETLARLVAAVLALLLASRSSYRSTSFVTRLLAGFAVFGARIAPGAARTWSPIAGDGLTAGALAPGGAACPAAFAGRQLPGWQAPALAAIALAALSAFSAEATRASAEAGWREGAAWTGAVLAPALLAAAFAGLFAGVPRRLEPLVVAAALAAGILVWIPALLAERARVSRELTDEVTLGL